MRKLLGVVAVMFGACGPALSGAVDGYSQASTSSSRCASSSDCDSSHACVIAQGSDRGQCQKVTR